MQQTEPRAIRGFSGIGAMARMLHSTSCIMSDTRSGDTLRAVAVRYVGFAVIGWSVVVGEVLARVDALLSGTGVRTRSSS